MNLSSLMELETEDSSLAVSGNIGLSQLCGTTLSIAEHRVLKLLLQGLSEKSIAGVISLSRHTVHNHTRVIFRAFGVHSRVQLITLLAKKTRSEIPDEG
jgi:DNA-binding CsgD family transcriptional regulator